MQVNLHSVSLASVIYTSDVSGKSVKSTLSVSPGIVLGLFLMSHVRTVYTFNKVLRSTLPVSPAVVLKSPNVSYESVHKYI